MRLVYGFVFEEPGREEIFHEIFFIFCVGTLSKWMETKDVYFVLMDYAPFLRNVGECKDHSEYSTSSFAFSRLSLQLIRPEKIQLIMRQTWTNNEMTETLAARWGLSTEAEIAKAAEVMYEKTCGHPRKMFHMFDTCATFDDLVVADADDIGDEQEWENVYRQLRLWQPLLEKWLPQILEKKPMDLTMAKNCLSPSLPHDQQRNISYAVIMERCHLGREGTLDEAIVYALPRIMAMILGIVQPFREYVRFIETYRKVTLDHAGVWEWVCIKRFQELFAKHCKPGEKLPKFFGADTVFGNLPDVQFPGDFIDLPKITSAGQQNSVSLSSLTAHPTKWSALMCEIQSRLQVVKSLCIKPLGQSASPDVILMKRIERFTPGGKRLRMATLAVALAMKNYNSTGFSETQLKHECKIFDQMFKILGATVANPTELAKSAVKPIQRAKPAATAKSEAKTTKQAKPAGASNAKWTKRKLHQNEGMRFDEETKESCIGEQRVELQESDERINVLIVCATNYCAGYAKAFGGKLYSVLEPPFDQTKNTAQYPNITEIMLLDLTTHESRAEFFGLEDDEVLGQALDRLIKRVVPEKLSNNISAS